jgi:hypothetical protein
MVKKGQALDPRGRGKGFAFCAPPPLKISGFEEKNTRNGAAGPSMYNLPPVFPFLLRREPKARFRRCG